MKDNYKNAGSDYTGKTISATGTVTFVSNSVKIEANKDSVVRSKSFSVTVTGKPATTYYVWVKGTSAMTSLYDDQPPMIKAGQEKVYFDNDMFAVGYAADNNGNVNPAGAVAYHPIGDYVFENAPTGGSIYSDVAQARRRHSTRPGTMP